MPSSDQQPLASVYRSGAAAAGAAARRLTRIARRVTRRTTARNVYRRAPRGAPVTGDSVPLARLLAGLEAVAVGVRAEAAEVLDGLAALQLEGAVHADVDDVLARAAVDRALAVEGPDVVVARAGLDRGLAVAGVDEVRAGAAEQHVALVGVVVARVPVAPEDVLAGAAGEPVGAVVPEQLVVERAAGLHAAAAVHDLPQDAADRRPALVADLRAAAGRLAPAAGPAVHVGGGVGAEPLGGAQGRIAAAGGRAVDARGALAAGRGVRREADGRNDQAGDGGEGREEQQAHGGSP